MSTTNTIGITGSDGVIPIYSPTDRWTIWSRDEIYTGQEGENKFIPKLKDYVIEPDTFTTYIVEFLDPVTYIPTLREIRPANMNFTLSQDDVLFGVGPGTQSDTYRVYIDTSVTPHILAVDVRLKIGGTLSNYAKIFKGSDTSNNGKVISRVYDNNNNFISENVGLELVAVDSHINYSIKTINVCHTVEDLVDGEIVTVVIYNDQGNVVSKRQLLVENTAFIRDANAGQKYVSHISLESAFLSPTNDNDIEFPLNIPVNALNLMGVVHYSDGTTLRAPVDGSKFSIFGLDQYVSNIVGQRIELVLNYALSPNEVAYGAVTSDGHYITEEYNIITVNPNNSYAVKLFVYPVWISPAFGYKLKWYMYNLDRNTFFDVTDHINFSDETGPYDPKAYGFLQRKAVSLNLNDVTSVFDSFRHVQQVDIVLNREPDDITTNTAWTVGHITEVNTPRYGQNIYAMRLNANEVNISSGLTTFTEWLDKTYLAVQPLIDLTVESAPIDPSHFVIMVQGQSIEFPIDQWDQNLTINVDVNQHEALDIRFIKRTSTGDLELAIVSMITKFI